MLRLKGLFGVVATVNPATKVMTASCKKKKDFHRLLSNQTLEGLLQHAEGKT